MSILAIDIGGTGTRAVLVDATGEHGAEATAPGVHVGADGIPLGAILDVIVARLPGDPVDTVSVGMSGLLGLTAPNAALAELRGHWPHARIVLASDAVTAAAAALGDRGGAVVALGTGVVGLATDFGEIWRRVDGWGHLLGDEGGGAWIGLRGLRAAVREHDGRAGGSALLLAEACAAFGPPEGLPWQLYTRDDRAGVLASFVPAVARAAEAGDPVARRIGERAAEAITETALALLTAPVPCRLALTGGLLGARTLLVEPLLASLAARVPSAEVLIAEARPIDGALALAAATDLPAGGRPPFVTIDAP